MNAKIQVQATINGEEIQFLCEPRQSLLEVLREEVELTGVKEGCGDGNCGVLELIGATAGAPSLNFSDPVSQV